MLDTISAKELDRYIERGGFLLIDLRPETSFRKTHIRGAVNMPRGVPGRGQRIPERQPLILYCERGALSMAVARKLEAEGHLVKTVVGGIRAYRGNYLESRDSR